MPRRPWLAPAAYAAVYLAWGSSYFAIRVGVRDFSAGGLCGLRLLLAGVLMLGLRALLRPRGEAAPRAPEALRAALIGTVILGGGTGFLCYAERTVPSGVAALVIGCSPVLFAVFNRWAGGPPLKGGQVAGGLLGLAGVAALALGNLSPAARLFPPSGLALLGAGMVCWTGGSVVSKSLRLPKDALFTSGVQDLAAGALLLAAARLRGEFAFSDLPRAPAQVWAAVVYLAVVGSLIGFTAYTWLLHHEPANRVSSYAFVNPAVAVLLGAAFLGERVTPAVAAAMALVLGGVSLSLWSSRPPSAPEGVDAV